MALTACRGPAPDADADGAAASGTTFSVRPYLWAPSIDGGAPGGGGGDPTDLDLLGLEDLEWAMMVAFEARPADRNWSLVVDSFYTRFDQEKPLIRTQLEASILEVAFARRGWQVEPMIGVRAWDLSVDVDLTGFGSPKSQETWVDPVLGLRGAWPIYGAWSGLGQLDVGGFGLQAEHTVQAQAVLRYATSHRGMLHLGYRHLDVEFQDFDLNVTLSGPFLGFSWTF